ncbi:MAG: SusC/RagA family TonB-linked outer membrane protein, partial [Tannerella sp.]|nr:SusC/RagA family TonB-linked outer membrane protein [Tannerella sp.]
YYNQLGGKIALDLTPLDGLTLSAVFAPTFIFNEGKEFRKAVKYYDAKDPSLALGYVARYNTTNLKESRNNNYRLVGQAFANYVKAFGWHNMNIMGGYETYYSYNGSLTAGRDNYTLNSYPYLDIGPLDYRNNSGNADEFAYQSFFGRAMYNYRQRYLFQVNIRRDGSSRFHKDYRWGTFPSVSAGWVLSEESFMEKTRSWMSYLKLRVSWGTLGNERIGNYPYQSSIGFSNILFNQGGKIISSQAAAQSKYAIQDISWETTKSTNIGLDVNFLDNRLRFAGDYFYKTTEDMLLALEIPSYVGYSNPDKNTGKMKTRGYELEVKWSDQIGDVFYSVSANMSDFVSKMGDLGGTEFLGDQVKKQGSQFNEWYGYLSDGIYQTQEEVDNSPKLNNNIKPGDVKYLDVSGPDGVPDGKISPEYDRVLLGGSLPRYMYGGSIQTGYKDVDFSLTFQGVGSQHVRMTTNMIQPLRTDWGNVPEILDGNYWSHYNTAEQNKNVKYPRLTTTNATSNYVMSDFWMFNGRYFRLKNITLGYTLPIFLTEKVKMNRVRLYLSATDLFSISKYPSGWDPETGATAYPITSSYLMGIMINF